MKNTLLPKNIDSTNLKHIHLSPKGIVKWLILAIFLLCLGHIAAFILDYVLHRYTPKAMYVIRYFDFNLENNIPTWFSVLIIAFASILLFYIYAYKKWNNIKGAYYWLLLGLIFAFISLDEFMQIHEEVATVLRPKLGEEVSGFLYWAWVIPYGLFVILMGAFFIRFLLNLPMITRNMFILSGLIYVGGALGLEFWEGYLFKKYGLNHIYNRILYFIEETMEMGGITLFIYALLDYIATWKIRLSFNLES